MCQKKMPFLLAVYEFYNWYWPNLGQFFFKTIINVDLLRRWLFTSAYRVYQTYCLCSSNHYWDVIWRRSLNRLSLYCLIDRSNCSWHICRTYSAPMQFEAPTLSSLILSLNLRLCSKLTSSYLWRILKTWITSAHSILQRRVGSPIVFNLSS